MSEGDVVDAHPSSPQTVESLQRDLTNLGIRPGSTLLVHSSLSALGWVCGGPEAVILALLGALGPAGTLVMPTHSSHLSEPEHWGDPPVPPSWWPTIRATMPPFDPRTTPSRAMGLIPETFRRWPGALRSYHPQVSFAALGPTARFVIEQHSIRDGLGDASPLARVFDLDGDVLLLGVGHERNTSLHLAEARATWPSRAMEQQGAPILVDGERRWVSFETLAVDSGDFKPMGAAFEAHAPEAIKIGRVGKGTAKLMHQRPLVRFGVLWIEEFRV